MIQEQFSRHRTAYMSDSVTVCFHRIEQVGNSFGQKLKGKFEKKIHPQNWGSNQRV